MTGHRGVLTLGLLAALALTAAFAWRLIDPPLAPPAKADMRGLARWLLRDLEAEPAETQLALVDRLQSELLEGGVAEFPWGDATKFLSQSQMKRLAHNAEYLKKVWFHARVAQYARCPRPERAAFLERQIAVLFRWLEIDSQLFAAGREEGSLNTPLTVGEFFAEVDRWIATAQGEEHTQMVDGVRDAVAFWLATRSLADQPPATVRELALHIAQNLEEGPPTGGFGLAFSKAELKQLEVNGHRLMEAWFREQARLYAALDSSQRPAFVEQQVAAMKAARVMELLQGESASGSGSSALSSAQAAFTFMSLSRAWVEHSDPGEKRPLADFLSAFQRCLFAEQMRAFFPLPGKRKAER